MPVMDGLVATKQLRMMEISIPIIGLTGNALAEDQASFLEHGASVILTKPVDRKHLATVLKECLSRSNGISK